MRSLAGQGRTVFVSSHLMSEMEHTADHLLVMGRGQLIADCGMAGFTTGGSGRVSLEQAYMELTAASVEYRIAEDAAIMRDGLTQTLTRRSHDVVAAVADAESLRRAVEEYRPDVAIIDVRMPPTHTDEGLRAAQEIHRDRPGVGALVFSHARLVRGVRG
jgi:ABC-type multidrug transport system ATPase subunit